MPEEIKDDELAQLLGDDSSATTTTPAPAGQPAAPKPSAASAVVKFVDPAALQRDVSISVASMENDIRDHAALLAYYGSKAANARLQRDKIKTSLEINEARISEEIRAKHAAEGSKLTEARLEQLIRIHPKYATLRGMLDEANAVLEQALIAIEAFKQRGSMLIQLSAGARQERAGDIALNAVANKGEAAVAALRNGKAA